MQGRRKSLDNMVIGVLDQYYPSIDLSRVRIADRINTIHGQAVTFGYNIYFPESVDFINKDDLRLLVHELEHVSQYRIIGGIQVFLSKYFPQTLIATFDFNRMRDGINIHDEIYIEREAISKEQRITDEAHDKLIRRIKSFEFMIESAERSRLFRSRNPHFRTLL